MNKTIVLNVLPCIDLVTYVGSFRFLLLTWNLCLQLTLQLLRPN